MYLKKAMTLLLVLLLLCVQLTACAGADPAESQNPENNTPGTEATQPTEEATQPPETEPTQPTAQTPVDIETTGGVVIVGKIGVDEQGWYIQPEAPLNITYRYFLESPSVFPEATRIQMFDPREDGVEKALYIGETVTASGTLRFYRDDFETLFFAPYTITIGKNAEHSYGAPDLQIPDAPQNLYDPSQPLPACMDLQIVDGAYTYNVYMLSRETLERMGNDFAEFYIGFVDAFLNYETEYPCTNKNYAEMLSTVLHYELPLYNACAEPFEFFRHYDLEKGTVSIHYKYSKEEFEKIKEQFFAAANTFLADVKPEQTDVEKAKAIYHALASRMTYDYSALEEFERKEDYYAYLYGSGVCVTFANVYNQLLTRVGIETTLAHCDNVDTIGHTWSVVTLNGQQYFCDPTYELSYDKGTGYRFFGMSYAERIANGTGAMGIRCGRYHLYTMDAEMIAAESLPR